MRTILVIGAGGHARVVIDVAKSAGFEVCGIIDINFLYNNLHIRKIGYDIPVFFYQFSNNHYRYLLIYFYK